MRNLALAAMTLMLLVPVAAGASDLIYSREIHGQFTQVYDQVHKALEDARFYVIFEANIGKNLARNAKRWGDDYNRSGFEQVRSLVICNPWYANQMLNLDPELIAVCPFSVSLLYRQGTATLLFERPGHLARGKAADLMWEIENTITTALDSVQGD